MKNFIIYDKEGTIKRIGVCPDNQVKIQPQENEFVIEGISDGISQKIVDGKIVDKTEVENNDYIYEMRKDSFPKLDFTLTDEEIDQQINEYYIGKVDVQQWKKDNYDWLRKQSYPNIEDQLDSLMKYLKTKQDLTLELEQTINKIDQVKLRWPKTEVIKCLK